MRHVLSTILLQQHFSNISCHKRIGFITFKSHEKKNKQTKTKTKQKQKKKPVLRASGLSKEDQLVRISFFPFFKYFSLSRSKNDSQNVSKISKCFKNSFFEETVSKIILRYFHKFSVKFSSTLAKYDFFSMILAH